MYFGFSKNHPGYKANIAKDPNYNNLGCRSIEDVKKQYGKYFDIVKVETNRWKGGKYGHHEGLIIAMRKK
ncbi:MAG: hypothetical protein ABIB98_03795 [bacterium]